MPTCEARSERLKSFLLSYVLKRVAERHKSMKRRGRRERVAKGKQFSTSCWCHCEHFFPSHFLFPPFSLTRPSPECAVCWMCLFTFLLQSRSKMCFSFRVHIFYSQHTTFYLPCLLSFARFLLFLFAFKEILRSTFKSKRKFLDADGWSVFVHRCGLVERREKRGVDTRWIHFWLNFVACGCSISLLILVMPSIEVNVEHDDGSRCQASEQISVKLANKQFNGKANGDEESCACLLLIVCQWQRANSAVADGECIERSQIECAPHFHNTLVASRHQIFTVSGQQHALDRFRKENRFIDLRYRLRHHLLALTWRLSLCDSWRNKRPLIVKAATFPSS